MLPCTAPEINLTNLDSSTFLSCMAATHALVETIASMTHVRVQDPIPCKQKRHGPLRMSLLRGTMPLSSPGSSAATRRCGFVIRTDSLFWGNKFSELLVAACIQVVKEHRRAWSTFIRKHESLCQRVAW